LFRENTETAVEIFEKAIEADPSYARAHAWRACSLSNLADWEENPDPDMFASAIESANLALELDPNEPEVHRIMGSIKLWFERDYDMGKYHFEKARELCPSDVFIICRYATMLIYFGEFEKALGELERAMRLDPFSHDLLFGAEALCHYWLGNYDKSITSFKKVKVLKAHLFYMALTYLKKEDKTMADQKLKEARAMTGMDIESFVKSEPYKDQEQIKALMVDLESIGD
jgi:tetratricopeptide (TPR) repeat protein